MLVAIQRIKIIIVDDHPIVSQGLTTYLTQQPDLHVVTTASSANRGLVLIRAIQPDMVIIDLHLPCHDEKLTSFKPSGIKLIGELREIFSRQIQIIALTGTPSAILKTWAYRVGADAFLTKDSLPEEIIKTIRWLRISQHQTPPTPTTTTLFSTLTEQELLILHALTQGLSDEEITQQLEITYNTIKFHLRNIYHKLNINNRRAAIQLALYPEPQNCPTQLQETATDCIPC